MLLFPLALSLVIALAFFITAILRLKSRISFFLAFFLLAYTAIVLATEIASVFHRITPGFVVFVNFILACIAGIAWLSAGKPDFLYAFRGKNLRWKSLFDFCHYPELLILGGIVFIAYAIGVFLILATPQNNYDSMTYHLSRIGYWLQHSTLSPWPTPNPRQTTFPPNAEIGLLWMALFWGSDLLSGFIQWLCVPVIMAAIYGMSGMLGANPRQSLMLSLIWATFPEVFLQSLTTMNDLVSAAFFTSAVYFLYTGFKAGAKHDLLLSGLALGLALGTKSTVILALPGLLLILIALLIFERNKVWNKLFTWSLLSCLAFLLVGAFSYAQNYIYYRNPFSISQWTNYFVNPSLSRSELVTKNLFLYSVQMADLTGVPESVRPPFAAAKSTVSTRLATHLPLLQEDGKERLLAQLRYVLSMPQLVHEDTAWFGPIFLFLFIPASIYQFAVGIRKKDALRLGLLGLLFGFAFVVSYAQDWTPYRGRYFVLISPFAMPLLAPWFGSYRGASIVRWAITLICILTLGQTILFNESKPLVGPNNIWGKDDLSVRVINYAEMESVLRAVEEFVPEDAVLGTRLSINAWDYPLFGNNLARKIIQIDPTAKEVDFQEKIDQGVDYFLIQPQERTFLHLPPDLRILWEKGGWLLLGACQSGDCTSEPGAIESVLGVNDGQNLASVVPELAGKVGILEFDPGEWPIEEYNGKGHLWLGEGSKQGLKIFLWSDDDREVTLSITVKPGPSRQNSMRTLLVETTWINGFEILPEGYSSYEKSFSDATTLDVKIKLQPGLNGINLQSLDTATIPIQPNGDQRPLLIMIKNILVGE